MGWAIGFAPVHGDGILVSDTRVHFTLMEKETFSDCMQKIHYVGPNILSGFTGSVKIGFRVVAEMKKQLGAAKLDHGWNLLEISNLWLPRLFRHIFENSEENEKSLGLQIVLVAAHPQKVHGGSSLPWIDAMRFSFPDFESEKGFMNQPLRIGNQSGTQTLADLLRRQFSVQMDLEDSSAQAAFIANQMHALAGESVLQVGLINRGKSVIVESSESNLIQSYGSFAKYCAEKKLEPFCALA